MPINTALPSSTVEMIVLPRSAAMQEPVTGGIRAGLFWVPTPGKHPLLRLTCWLSELIQFALAGLPCHGYTVLG